MPSPHIRPPARPRHKRLPRIGLVALALLLATAALVTVPQGRAGAAVESSGGWTTDVSTDRSSTTPGNSISITADVTADWGRQGLVDIEIIGPSGESVHQQFWDAQSFQNGVTRSFATTWDVPGDAPGGRYAVKVGLFATRWASLDHWNNGGASFTVGGAPSLAATPSPISPRSITPPVPTPMAPPSEGGLAFAERFDNSGPTLVTNGGALGRFRFSVFHRNLLLNFKGGHGGHWSADHDMNCGGVETQHEVDAANTSDYFFLCRDHMMSTLGDVDGYSLITFSPEQSFRNVREVCWDVNLTDLGNRLWWEVAVVPTTTSDYIVDDALIPDPVDPATGPVPYSRSGGEVAHWGPFDHKLGISEHKDGRDYTAGSDKATRWHHCFTDNGNGTVTITQQRGSSQYSYTAPGRFPTGTDAKVVFKMHAYTPEKSETGFPRGFTWHWDNITVATR